MSNSRHTSEIAVNVDDARAHASLDAYLAKLERAREIARGLSLGPAAASQEGKGEGGGGAPPGGAGGRPTPGSTTTESSGGATGGGGRARDARGRFVSAGGNTREESGGAPAPDGGGGAGGESLAWAGLRRAAAVAPGLAGAAGAGPGAFAAAMTVLGQQVAGLSNTFQQLAKKGGRFSKVLGALGGGGMVAGLGMVAGGAVATIGISARWRAITERAGMERTAFQLAGIGGFRSDPQRWMRSRAAGGYGLPEDAAMYGMQTSEALSMMSGVARQGGFGIYMPYVRQQVLAHAARGGDPGVIGGLLDIGGRGGGAAYDLSNVGPVINELRSRPGQMQLYGGQGDEFLNRLIQAARAGTEAGLKTGVRDIAAFAAGADRLGVTDRGAAALRMAQRGPQAAQGLLGGFAGLSDAGLQMWAFQQTSDPLEAAALLQDLQRRGPTATRNALVSTLGGGWLGRAALAGSGDSVRNAGRLLRAQPVGAPGMGQIDIEYVKAAMPAAMAVAVEALVRLRATEDRAQIKEWGEAAMRAEATLLGMTAPGGPLDKIVEIGGSIMRWVQGG